MKKCLYLLLVTAFVPAVVAAADLPVPVQTAQGVSYYNGGVGVGERAAMPQLYSVKFILATEKGLYLNDAEIVVLEKGAEVLRVQADNGPWLIADLPPGTYTVEASLEGKTARSKVTVGAGSRKTVYLRWKSSDIDMGL